MRHNVRWTNAWAGFLERQVRSRLVGQRRPLLAGYKLTLQCNLGCIHCPFWRRKSDQLDYAGACRVLHRLHDLGVRILIFEGGEPLLWRDGQYRLEDLLKYAKTLFWSVGVTTNGTLPLPVEADVIWVSVDGLEETTCRIRGPIFAKQMENIGQSRHRRLFANVTINRLNVAEVPSLVQFLAQRVRGITIQFYYPYGDEADLLVPSDQRAEVLDRLITMKRQGYPLLDSYRALTLLKRPGWRCHSWLIASAEPDGEVQQGCYLKGRAPITCDLCGFAAHVEMSLAYDLDPGALRAGLRIFGLLPGFATRQN
ncbi:MAG: radical SAM protein [Anaerolineae bacterium]